MSLDQRLESDPLGRGQNYTFSEFGHVAYQIKGNDACNNLVVDILPADPLGQTVKIQRFQNMVMLHIKLKWMTHATTK